MYRERERERGNSFFIGLILLCWSAFEHFLDIRKNVFKRLHTHTHTHTHTHCIKIYTFTNFFVWLKRRKHEEVKISFFLFTNKKNVVLDWVNVEIIQKIQSFQRFCLSLKSFLSESQVIFVWVSSHFCLSLKSFLSESQVIFVWVSSHFKNHKFHKNKLFYGIKMRLIFIVSTHKEWYELAFYIVVHWNTRWHRVSFAIQMEIILVDVASADIIYIISRIWLI